MRAGRALIGIHALAGVILACNLQGGQPSEPELPGNIPTQALTVLAPTETPASPTPTEGAGVKVSVTSDTNCRTGPAKAFDLTFLAHPGTEFNVVGKNLPTGYWIVDNPAGGTCWLWGEYAVVKGDISNLPEYPSPQLPTPASTETPKSTQTPGATKTPEPAASAPKAPKRLSGTRRCESYLVGMLLGNLPMWRERVSLAWDDNSSDEVGYRAYQNDAPIANLPKDTGNYLFVFGYRKGTGGQPSDEFAIEAFNGAGSSARATTIVPRCQ